MAVRDFAPGDIIFPEQFRMVPWPGALPAGAIFKQEEILEHVITKAVHRGEPLLKSSLKLDPLIIRCSYAPADSVADKKVLEVELKVDREKIPRWFWGAVPVSVYIAERRSRESARILVKRAQISMTGIFKRHQQVCFMASLFLESADAKGVSAALAPSVRNNWSVWLVAAEEARNWDPGSEEGRCKFLLPLFARREVRALRGSINFDALPASSPIETVKPWALELSRVMKTFEAFRTHDVID